MASVEERLAAVEEEVIRLREQVTDAHTLAAHADRDVAEFRGELRAQTRLIQAVHQTQVQQGRRLDAQGERLDALQSSTEAGFAQVEAGMQKIVGLLNRLIGD